MFFSENKGVSSFENVPSPYTFAPSHFSWLCERISKNNICLVNERFENKDAFFSGPANIYNYAHESWHGSLVFTRKLLIVIKQPNSLQLTSLATLKFFIHSSFDIPALLTCMRKNGSLRQLHMGHVSPGLPTEHVKIATPTKQFFSSVTDWQQTNRFFKETHPKTIPAKKISFLTGSKLNEQFMQ